MDRSPADRLRDYRYRFSQAVVFGVPVIVLEWIGHGLGGTESTRYVGLFNALLAGWVVYVAGMGMLADGLLALPRRIMVDLFVGLAAIAIYLVSLVSLVHLLFLRTLLTPLLFQWTVILLAGWAGLQWWRWRRRCG